MDHLLQSLYDVDAPDRQRRTQQHVASAYEYARVNVVGDTAVALWRAQTDISSIDSSFVIQ